MSSPMFSIPHPTDDELHAQQPVWSERAVEADARAVSPHPASRSTLTTASAPGYRPDDQVKSHSLGRTAVFFSAIATALTLAATVVLCSLIASAQAELGTDVLRVSELFGPDSVYTTWGLVTVGAQVLATILGITGLITGFAAIASARGRGSGAIAVTLAVLAPIISFALFLAVAVFQQFSIVG